MSCALTYSFVQHAFTWGLFSTLVSLSYTQDPFIHLFIIQQAVIENRSVPTACLCALG